MKTPPALERDQPLLWSPGTGTEVGRMFLAASQGDLGTLEGLLSANPALVRCSYQYRTPLHFAVRENQAGAATLLLARGARPNPLAVGPFLDGELGIARDRGYHELERILAAWCARAGMSDRGNQAADLIRARDRVGLGQLLDADPSLLEAGDQTGNRPLHWAVMTRQVELIDYLLDRGADLEARRPDGARPLQLTNGDYHCRGWRDVPPETTATAGDVYRHLRGRGADLDLTMAATMGHLDRVRELLDHDPSLVNRIDPYVTYYPGSGAPLKNAAGGGHLAIVELLLQRGADPNLAEDGIAPLGGALYGAVSGGHFAIAELLLEHGANPNGTVESSADCLTIALLRGDGRMAELLASYGAARRLELLAYYGDVQTGAAVLAARPDLADDPEVLSIAAEEGQESFVRLMLRLRPDLARRLVCPGAQTRALDVLLFRHGADPGRADWLGITPLHRFAAGGEIEKATLFLDHGAPLEARDDELQSTPLGVAARCGQTAMVELLLARGARPNPPDDPPWATPLAWASRREHHEIVRLLEQRGAR